MNKRNWACVCGVVGMIVATTAVDASASVRNPGTFDFDVTSGHDSRLRFKTGINDLLNTGSSSYLTATIDSVGDFHGMSSHFPVDDYPTGTGTHIYSQLIVNSGAGTGYIDPMTHDLEINLSVKIQFSYAGIWTCTTPNFIIDATSAKWSSSGVGGCTVGYDESSGDFCVYDSGFSIPAVGNADCNGFGATINTDFGLPSATGSATSFQIILGNVSPPVVY